MKESSVIPEKWTKLMRSWRFMDESWPKEEVLFEGGKCSLAHLSNYRYFWVPALTSLYNWHAAVFTAKHKWWKRFIISPWLCQLIVWIKGAAKWMADQYFVNNFVSFDWFGLSLVFLKIQLLILYKISLTFLL